MKEINMKLPFFPGFYESWAENGDTEYYAIHEEMDYNEQERGYETEYDDYTFDWQTRRKDIMDSFVEAFKNNAPEFILDVKFDEVVGPRNGDYNPWRGGHNDYLYCNVEFDDNYIDTLVNFINDNIYWFSDRIAKDWTSCDGFWSFMENETDAWIEKLKEEDERYIETTLQYYMSCNNKNISSDLMYDTMENIYDLSYVTLNEDVEKREYEKTHQPGWDMTNQTEIKFED